MGNKKKKEKKGGKKNVACCSWATKINRNRYYNEKPKKKGKNIFFGERFDEGRGYVVKL